MSPNASPGLGDTLCPCGFFGCNKCAAPVGAVTVWEGGGRRGSRGAYARSLSFPFNFAVNFERL